MTRTKYFFCAIIIVVGIITYFGIISEVSDPVKFLIPPDPYPALSWRLGLSDDQVNPCSSWLTRDDVHASVNDTHEAALNDVAREYVNLNKDFTIKPGDIQLIPEYRNPCWEQTSGVNQNQSTSFKCMPYFYLLGFSKCGTTDMFRSMLLHREIGRVKGKEPCWWTKRRIYMKKEDPDYPNNSGKMSMDFYLSHYDFKNIAEKEQIMGDWSTNGIWHNDLLVTQLKSNSFWEKQPSYELTYAVRHYRLLAPHLIYQYNKIAKFLVTMRNPVERLYSGYLFAYYKRKLKTKPSQSDFHRRVLKTIVAFKDCLKEGNTVRFCTYNPKVRMTRLPGGPKINLQKGVYVVFIADLLKVIPREQVFFINFETYKKDRMPVLDKIARFLGMKDDPDFASKIATKANEEPSVSRESFSLDIGPMWKNTSDILTDFYRPFNELLMEVLNDRQFSFN